MRKRVLYVCVCVFIKGACFNINQQGGRERGGPTLAKICDLYAWV